MNANLRNFALWVIIVLLLLALFSLFQNPGQRTVVSNDITFSQLLADVDQGRDVRRGDDRSGAAVHQQASRLTDEGRQVPGLRRGNERHRHESCGGEREEDGDEIADFRHDDRHAITGIE